MKTMLHDILHTLLPMMALLLSAGAAVSCDNNNNGDDTQQVGIAFTISLDAPSTRAANEGWNDYNPSTHGTGRENAINPDDIQVMVCDSTGESLAQVGDVHITRRSATEFAVTGVWRDSDSRLSMARRIMVLANCHASTEYNIVQTSDYLPMWGVAKLPALAIGKSNNIGNIDLLRAVAKVGVTLRDDMIEKGFSIASLTLDRYNTRGYIMPAGYKTVDNTADLSFAATLNVLNSAATSLDFTANSVAYIPEYDNTSQEAVPSTITVELNRNGKHEGTYTLHFADYDSSGAPTGNAYDIMRNHIYAYTIYKSGDEMAVTLHVREWNVRKHDDIIM